MPAQYGIILVAQLPFSSAQWCEYTCFLLLHILIKPLPKDAFNLYSFNFSLVHFVVRLIILDMVNIHNYFRGIIVRLLLALFLSIKVNYKGLWYINGVSLSH